MKTSILIFLLILETNYNQLRIMIYRQIKSVSCVGAFFLFEVGPTGTVVLVPDPLGFVTPPNRAFAKFFFAFYSGVTIGFFGFEGGTTTGLLTKVCCYCFGEFPL